MRLRFGTDGIRGVAHTDITVAAVAALGRAGAEVLGADGFAVGRDTRESGPDLAAALHAGITAAGGSSVDLGVVPTPAVADWCVRESVAGAVISASHNPWSDNGVKFFAPGGLKLSDDIQERVQRRFDELLSADPPPPTVPPRPADGHDEAVQRHVDSLVASIAPRRLDGLRLVVDAANGSASVVAGRVFEQLGADVTVVYASPDGRNINDRCGSNHPDGLRDAVVAADADAGLALDGDADRVVAVDHTGALLDGDHIMAICALDRHRRGVLEGDSVVVTVMTNLGFRRSMDAAGVRVVETPVGDRHVLEALDTHDLVLGGEQSGHIIFRDLAPTGDGLLSGVQLLDVVVRTGTALADLAAAAMTRLPQVLHNVRLATRPADLDEQVAPLVAAAEAELGDRGRILVRPSGTEPLLRVMVEAETDEEAAATASSLVDAVTALLG